jgi:hypothetical protein
MFIPLFIFSKCRPRLWAARYEAIRVRQIRAIVASEIMHLREWVSRSKGPRSQMEYLGFGGFDTYWCFRSTRYPIVVGHICDMKVLTRLGARRARGQWTQKSTEWLPEAQSLAKAPGTFGRAWKAIFKSRTFVKATNGTLRFTGRVA